MKKQNWLFILMGGCVAMSASAQDTKKSEDMSIELNPVVVTGTGTHQRLKNTPVPVEVISASDLKKAGITNLKDAVTMLSPSFSFSATAMADYTTMGGLGNEKLLILVDGQKLAGNVSGATDISRIDMSNVRRIEILKGAASSLYGSDAIGGVINIITNRPKDVIQVTSNSRIEKYGQYDQSVNLDIAKGKIGSYTSFMHRQSDGWQLNPEAVTIKNGKPGDPVATDKMASDKFHSNVVNQLFNYAPTKALSLYAKGSYYYKENDRPVTEYNYNLGTTSYNLGLGAKYQFTNPSDYIQLDLYNDNFETQNLYITDVTDKKGNITIANGSKALNQRQHYYSANLKGVFRAGDHNKLTVGTEYIKDILKNPDAFESYDEQKKDVYTWALYAQDEIKLFDKLQAVVGLRYTYHESFKNNLTPKATLMYTLGSVNLRATYAGGFRAPSVKELYYVKEKGTTISLGNTDLKAEKSDYFSVNAEYVHSRFSVSATAYINNIRNLIDLYTLEDPSSVVDNPNSKYTYKQYRNVSKARTSGIDVSFNSYIGYGFSLGASYSYTDARDRETELRLPRSIYNSGNLNANWTHTWGLYRFNVNLAGQMRSNRYEDAQENAPGFSIWNLTTNHVFNLGKFSVEPTVGINNIFNYKDDRYYGYYYATANPGRTVFASVLLRFKQ